MDYSSDLHFLLVEDLVSDSFLLQRQLKKISKNPEIRFVDSELGLINALKTYIPDIIITDFNLVGMDAFDVIRIAKEYNPKIPIIVITGHLKNESDRDLLIEKGAEGFFLKEPINTLNERLSPLFDSILEKNQENMENIDRERKRYMDRRSHSDFLRAHDFETSDEEPAKESFSFWKTLRLLFGSKQKRTT
ncbi:response regulator [Aequorivita sp. H23M31]|uniref:Response regulator n=1 Tax=Aequorivita ciconiae TaxID=2494375 RepID=A0A410G1H9_9FLAO|nr:response regulator [Aequorivita sp. H23M31]QAA81099.1 response regulator [Aequorivita sp. H23M31]